MIQMSISGGMVEWIVVYSNSGILDNKENKPMWTSSDMDEFYKYVEWQQQDTKEQWFHLCRFQTGKNLNL